MTLVSTRPNAFPSFSSLFDDFFNSEIGDWKRSNYSASNTTLPKVNIREDDNGYVVEMAAPGMKKDDFHLQLDQNVLTISSNKVEEGNPTDSNYTRREFSYQSFQRSFSLPDSVDGEKVSAIYENGILKVAIPKREEAKPKPPKLIKVS